MVIVFWWLSAILLIVGLLAWGFAYLNRRSITKKPYLVANTEYLQQLPSLQKIQKRSKVLRLASLILAALLVFNTAVLSGRLATESVQTPQFANRDIVLCLDVSGSMYSYDLEILEAYLTLVDNFSGERVGLSIFNSTSRTVFPLTNDYRLIREELQQAIQALSYSPDLDRIGSANYDQDASWKFWDFVGSVINEDFPPSLIADGLASCTQLFDRAEEERSRFIIFATDNDPGGEGIYTLPEATDLAIERDIVISAFYPVMDSYCAEECAKELQREVEKSGGQMWASGDTGAISQIVTQIQAAQADSLGLAPRILVHDQPLVFFILSLIVLIALIAVSIRGRN